MLAIDVDLVEIGMTVWALNADSTDADMRSVKGGIVVAVDQHVDSETGEITRTFTTATPWRGAVRFDFVADKDVAQVEPLNVAAVRNLIRTAGGVVAKTKRIFTTDEAKCVTLQHELLRVLG
jgi:hypothetical protein